jgi:hypothetical protein
VILKLGVIAALPMLALAAAAAMGPLFVVVDVREGSADGHHIVVPAPVSLVRTALFLAPVDLDVAEEPDLKRVAPVARRLLEDLRTAPDVELVRVTEPDESVSIRKVGKEIRVDVAGRDGDRVHVWVPIGFVDDVLRRASDGRITPRELAEAMGKLPRGRLVEVQDGADRVSVRLY